MTLGKELRDWVGLYRAGTCDHTEPNKHLRHKCYIQWEYLPVHALSGQIHFHFQPGDWGPGYRVAGDFEVRYFYGMDPGLEYFYPGPNEQGYVCHEWVDGPINYPNQPILDGELRNDGPTDTPSKFDPQHSLIDEHGFYNADGNLGHSGMRVGVEDSDGSHVKGLTVEDCECDPNTVQSQITIISATLGPNCQTFSTVMPLLQDNALTLMKGACDKNHTCVLPVSEVRSALMNTPGTHWRSLTGQDYKVGNQMHALEAWQMCHKDLHIEYTCEGHSECPPSSEFSGETRGTRCKQTIYAIENDAGDLGKTINFSCPQRAAKSLCLSYRAACARCALDAAATATIRVVSQRKGGLSESGLPSMDAWVDTMHHFHQQSPSSMPGFEVAVPV